MNTSELIIFISSALNVSIASFVLFKKPKSFVHQSFFFSGIGIVVWSAGFALLRFFPSPLLLTKIILLGGLIWVASLYLFVQSFPNKHFFKIKNPLLFFLPLVFAATLIFSNLVISDIDFSSGFVNPINAKLFPVFALFIITYLMLSLVQLYKNFNKSAGLERLKMKYLTFGLTIFITTTLIFDLILPTFGIMYLNALGPLSSFILLICLSYAILRYQLMDIRVVIQRGLIYLILLSCVILGYISILSLLHSHFLRLNHHQIPVITGIITTLLGIIIVPWIDRFLRNATDTIFFKERYRYREALQQLSKTLHETMGLDDLLRESSQNLLDIFKVKDVHYVFNTTRYNSSFTSRVCMTSSATQLLIPIVFKNELIATLIVSEKKSGDAFNAEDVDLLETFSYQCAIALEKARLLKEVQDYSKKLEERVEERTKDIHELLERQETTLLDISHNLQTPLTVIKTELALLGNNLPHSYKKNFDVFEKSIDKVSGFVTKLLNFSRRSMGIQGPRELFNFSDYLEEIFEYLSLVAENNNISSSLECSESMMIYANKKDIEELVNNIVSNAIKYRGERKYSLINISLRRSDGYAVFSVWDNGLGIPRKELKKIFQRFYRTRDSESFSGTGLGLAICKKIAEAHDGDINIESVLGSWTLCTVRIPLATS